jgi:hypothetical protein
MPVDVVILAPLERRRHEGLAVDAVPDGATGMASRMASIVERS